jgi:Protein of unknown function (DUF3866)
MLKLRRAVVVEADPSELAGHASGPGERCERLEQQLRIELLDAGGRAPAGASAAGATGGSRVRPAIADLALVGRAEAGDEVIVNVQALDLGLGSGGFDIVHANLTRGLAGGEARGAGVMKLNYTSLQHAVAPVEDERLWLPLRRPVAVLALHGQLSAVTWAFAQAAPAARLGYVQTEGGALPGSHSRTVRTLRERGLLAGHLTAGAAFGGEAEAVTTAGALHHGLCALGWDAAVCGPGPGIVGSSSPLGHGGMQALDSAHVALALGCRTLVVARASCADERARHRGVSHHTLTVLDLLLEPVTVPLPAGTRVPPPLEAERRARITRHDWCRAHVDLPGFAACGLPAATMGRGLTDDPLFFAAALAGGAALAEALSQLPHHGRPGRAHDQELQEGAPAPEAKLQG